MATLSKTLEIILTAQDLASDTVRDVGTAFDELGGKAEGLAAPFANIADTILKFDAILLGMATTIGVLSVNEAAKFETSLVDLQKVLGEGEGNAKDYAGALKDLALEYGVNANELVLSAADFRRSGIEIEESIALVNLSLDLMLAGGVTAAEATEILKSSMQGFGIPAAEVIESATRIGDVLNYVADNSASSFTELATGFKDIAPAAKLTGLSFEEIAAQLAVVIGAGNSGAETANALKTIFLRLAVATGDAAGTMKDLGVEFDSAGKPIGSIKDILDQIAPSWAKLTDEQKLQNAEMLAGKNQATKFIALMDNFGGAQDLAAKATDNATDSIRKQVEIVLQAAEVQFDRTTESVRQLAQTLGDQLLVSSSGAVGGVESLATAFQRLIESGQLDPFFDLINDGLDQLGTTFKDVAQNLPEAFAEVDLSDFLNALEGVGEEVRTLFAALFGEIDVSTPEGLADALQLVVDGLTLLANVTRGIISQFEPLFALIRAGIIEFTRLDDASQVNFGEFLGAMKLIADLGPKVAAALLLIAQTTLDMERAVSGGFGLVIIAVNVFQAAFNQVTFILTKFAQGAVGVALALAELDAFMNRNAEDAEQYRTRVDLLRGTMEFLGDAADKTAEDFKRNADEMRDGWGKVIGESDKKADDLQKTLNSAKETVKEFGKDAEDAGDGVESLGIELGKLEDITLPQFEYGDELDGLAADVDHLTDSLDLAGVKVSEVVDENGNLVRSYEQIGDGTVKATGGLSIIETAFGKSAKAADEATKESDSFRLKMEEIASNEKIKLIEAKISLDVAQLEAETRQVEAAFESVSATIDSTAQVLGDLYGLWTGADSLWDKAKIEGWIRDENKRRDAAMDKQNDLIQAQIDSIKARTAAMARGNALITVSGDGLAPHLEAFMWEVLRAIQVRASADMQEFLLGIGAAPA